MGICVRLGVIATMDSCRCYLSRLHCPACVSLRPVTISMKTVLWIVIVIKMFCRDILRRNIPISRTSDPHLMSEASANLNLDPSDHHRVIMIAIQHFQYF